MVHPDLERRKDAFLQDDNGIVLRPRAANNNIARIRRKESAQVASQSIASAPRGTGLHITSTRQNPELDNAGKMARL
eukprot:7498531-Heterocapsa_arctica.AAC.1